MKRNRRLHWFNTFAEPGDISVYCSPTSNSEGPKGRNNRGKFYPCILQGGCVEPKTFWFSGKAYHHCAKPILHQMPRSNIQKYPCVFGLLDIPRWEMAVYGQAVFGLRMRWIWIPFIGENNLSNAGYPCHEKICLTSSSMFSNLYYYYVHTIIKKWPVGSKTTPDIILRRRPS